jgi:hypothetical protein
MVPFSVAGAIGRGLVSMVGVSFRDANAEPSSHHFFPDTSFHLLPTTRAGHWHYHPGHSLLAELLSDPDTAA